MSGNGQNEEGAKESSGGGGGGSGGDDGRDMYRPKNVSTVVRVLTVTAYLLSVSMAAILLSVYYVFVWKSPELPVDGARLEARRDHGAYLASLHNHTDDYYDFGYLGRSNTSVNENVTYSLPSNLLEQSINTTDDTGLDFEFPANLTNNSIQQIKPLNLTSNDSGTNETDINT
ncbi:PREDICTED: uncharacterized protein LOC106120191 isoform X1 [Papilio xuthus]|uniref:Uncharacterized protein LOC106120191 isoform X1 n=1 Tax=Papilio xuthus TaxID=66420 RepID=A0AAJ7EBT3_PAPXU|nr:PREDICTED: uncharacterized protein LOC106120191 isoform X1 [Papilio xuthus]